MKTATAIFWAHAGRICCSIFSLSFFLSDRNSMFIYHVVGSGYAPPPGGGDKSHRYSEETPPSSSESSSCPGSPVPEMVSRRAILHRSRKTESSLSSPDIYYILRKFKFFFAMILLQTLLKNKQIFCRNQLEFMFSIFLKRRFVWNTRNLRMEE